MSTTSAERVIRDTLKNAGITVNGREPWDVRIHDRRLYERVLSQGTLGAGEAYMDGWWDCDDIDEMVRRLTVSASAIFGMGKRVLATEIIKAKLKNPQTVLAARKNISVVYDLDNDLYETMLGRTMAYTCGYWKEAKTLDAAQDAKYDLICRKLQLKPGMTLLDIGCGWGGLLAYAQKHYKAKVTGLTLSKEQARYVKEKHPGVEVVLQDYREFGGRSFDRITTVGMIEHVGVKNYRTFFAKVNELLTDQGMYLLHTIGSDKYSHSIGDPWMDKYIFPGGQLPSVKQLATAFEGIFALEDWHNFGIYYAKTLHAWNDNFVKTWPRLKKKYDERFYRMWRYYLLTCAGTFRARGINLWQIVLTKNGLPGGYDSIR